MDISSFDTFDVSAVIETFAQEEGLNVSCEGIDDTCYGMVIAADKAFIDFLTQHRAVYNYQIIDGDPIRIVRRSVDDDLTIDYEINQTECITRNGPAVTFQRLDLTQIPGQVEVQYIDASRDFAVTTQLARHRASRKHQLASISAGTSLGQDDANEVITTKASNSVAIDFVITADQARALAYDMLYRIWYQQLSITFEHKDISIEPGDTVQLTCDQGIFTILVQETTYTKSKSNLIVGTALLSSRGFSPTGGTADAFVPNNEDMDTESWLLTVM